MTEECPPIATTGKARSGVVLIGCRVLARSAQVAEFGLTCKSLSDGKIFAAAPEKLTGQARSLTPAQDVYSFGTLMYEMFMREQPADTHDAEEWLARLAVRCAVRRLFLGSVGQGSGACYFLPSSFWSGRPYAIPLQMTVHQVMPFSAFKYQQTARTRTMRSTCLYSRVCDALCV